MPEIIVLLTQKAHLSLFSTVVFETTLCIKKYVMHPIREYVCKNNNAALHRLKTSLPQRAQ